MVMQAWQGENSAKANFQKKLEGGMMVMEHDGTRAKASLRRRGQGQQ